MTGCSGDADTPTGTAPPPPPVPTSVSVSPAAAELTALGATVQLSARVRDQNGRAMEGVAVSWSSADTLVATVDSAGLVTAVGGGVTTVAATAGSASGSAAVSVMQSVASVAVSASADTIAIADTLRLLAEARDENSHLIAGAEFSWSSSDSSVVTVDASGLVRGISKGAATVTASAGGARDGVEITVVNPDRAALVALYEATDGPNWVSSGGWLTDAPLRDWHGVSVDDLGRVIGLQLGNNKLVGSIPPELGNLSRLKHLYMHFNELEGSVPPQLGRLSSLTHLWLAANDLTGVIPAELGALDNLAQVWLDRNELTGPIPPELGALPNLSYLSFNYNELTGPLPSELGNLSSLRTLSVMRNALAGPVPPEFGNLAQLQLLNLAQNDLVGSLPPELGGLTKLRALQLSHNARLSGAIPLDMTALSVLDELLADGTGLCAPSDPGFVDWLNGVAVRRLAACDPPAGSTAYLTQAVQSLAHPVPLVAGEPALLRVFVTAEVSSSADMPPVRARFYLNGEETHAVDIPGRTTAIPTAVEEGDLSKSANARIPGHVIHPGLEMVIDIDPQGALDPRLGVAKRIPATGRASVEVHAMPDLELTVIPMLSAAAPDSSILSVTQSMTADPMTHPLLEDTRTRLPVAGIDARLHEPVVSSSNDARTLLAEVEAIRILENGSGHYMGLMTGHFGGSGYAPGRASISEPNSDFIAHELGHNFSLFHAPCGDTVRPGQLDPFFPQTDGSTGAWGYDFRGEGSLVPPDIADLMSYCEPDWIGDYSFTKALRFRRADESDAMRTVAAPVRGILLWGGVDDGGVPFLRPAFYVEAPPALPASAGEYEIRGADASGRSLFSLSLAMPAVPDGDGGASFAFVLPVRGWRTESLASIALSGPGGSATLDREVDRPMTIWRDPATGRVLGFLDERPPASHGPGRFGSTTLSTTPRIEVLFSRGIPTSRIGGG